MTGGMIIAIPDETERKAEIKQMSEAIPLGHAGDPGELANVVDFLASEASSYINGADTQVDGGLGQI